MLKKAFFLMSGIALCTFLVGCGSGTTAAEIAESYGILNRHGRQSKTAGIIQSGQADAMIKQGIARIRNRTAGLGGNRVLVTEYIISGEVYRVEVRRAIDPTKNIPLARLRYATSQQGSNHQDIALGHLDSVWGALRKHSYEARPVVAYRAWRGLDKKVRGVEVLKGPTPDWDPSQNDMNLYVRTMDWPMVTMWFRGLASDDRHGDSRGPARDEASEAGGGQYQSSCDGRWVMESPGPGVQGQDTVVNGRTHFINMKLYGAIGS